MRRAAFLAATAILVPTLAACSSVHEAIDGPKMGPMAYPAPLIGQTQPEFASAREPAPAPVTPNSLWRTGARTFFNDQRAGRVGDILTVLITVNDSANTSAGTGGVNRAEQISLTIAAVVTQVLPNGNMVLQGTQEIKTNDDIRQLTVAGVVRPEDISSSNTILSSQIAEARINYGGRGDISAVQKTPAGTALLQRFWPF